MQHSTVASRDDTQSKASTEKGAPEVYEPPLDGGLRAWLVVCSCFLLTFNLLGLTYAFGVYQAHYAIRVFPSESPKAGCILAGMKLLRLIATIFVGFQHISMIGSTCMAFTLSTGVPAGRAVELFGYRKVAFGGSVISVLSLVAAGFCRTVPTLIITQGLFSGIASGVLFIPANAAPAQWFPTRRSLAIGISSSGAGVGGIFWSFTIRAIIARMGYQWALWLSACIAACIYAIALCFLETRPVPLTSRNTSLWSSLIMFKDPKFVTFYLSAGLGVFGYMVPFFYVPSYAQLQLGASSTVGSILSAIMDLGIAVGRVVMGQAADSRLGTMNTIISAMALSGLSQLALWIPAAHSLPLLYVFAFFYGFLGGGFIGLLPAVLAHIFDPEKLAAITGLFFTSEVPGYVMAGGPIAGAIFTACHERWTPVILYSGLTLFCGSLFAVATRFQVERRIFVTI